MKTVYALLLLTAIADSAIAATSPQDAAKPAATVHAAAASAVSPAATAPAISPTATLPPGHAPINAKPVDLGKIKVAKASGPDAHTVAEINTKRVELKDKTVVVHAKVVKFTPDVLKKNWIHLRDGTGSDADYSNDVLVTTNEQAKVGDVVLVKGVVRNDKDFGAGYAYKVLIEDGVLQK